MWIPVVVLQVLLRKGRKMSDGEADHPPHDLLVKDHLDLVRNYVIMKSGWLKYIKRKSMAIEKGAIVIE